MHRTISFAPEAELIQYVSSGSLNHTRMGLAFWGRRIRDARVYSLSAAIFDGNPSIQTGFSFTFTLDHAGVAVWANVVADSH